MSKTLVCTNVLSNVNSLAYGSHCQEWFRMGRNTQDNFILFHPDRFSIDNARNQAAKVALETECDYIYFLDDDMVLTPNTYIYLKSCDADIVQALTFVRGMPFDVMAFKNVGTDAKIELKHFNDYAGHVKENGTFECCAVGFACVLLKVSPLRKISPPYFITGAYTTEDVYYCLKLREKLGEEVKILVDTRVPTGHILHPEIISAENRDKLIEYFGGKEEEKAADRGTEYLKACRKQLEQLQEKNQKNSSQNMVAS